MPPRAHIIHLKSATERTGIVQAIQRTFFMRAEIAEASDGAEWLTNPAIAKASIHGGRPATQGQLGCAQSHLELLYKSLKDDIDRLVILEDDCEFLADTQELVEWVTSTHGHPWDILLLGANEYVESEPEKGVEGVALVRRFWGTHAMILKPKAVRAAMKVFAEAQKEGIFLPADWMYNEAIRKEGLKVLGPADPKALCRQLPGLVSAITGNVREA